MMLRVLAALVLLVFAAGFVVEACGPAASQSPGATPATTIPVPSSKPRTPSATIEVPPPIN